jgi:hypothetical protein
LAASLVAVAIGLALRFACPADMALILRISLLALGYIVVYLAIMVGCFREGMPIQMLVRLARDVLSARFAGSMKTRRVLDGRG